VELIRRSDVADGTVKPLVVVAIHKVCHHPSSLLKTGRRFGTDALLLGRLMPSLDLAIALRIERRSPHVGHSADPDEFLEVPGDELGAVVRDDPRMDANKPLPGPLEDDLYIGFGHPLPKFPMDHITAVAIQNRAQVVEGPTDVDIGHVHVPVLMSTKGLFKALALPGGRLGGRSQKTRSFQNPIDAAGTDGHHILIQHHKR